jgi:hypothetical protein
MLRALLAHHQEALHIQQLVYFVRIVSARCYPASNQSAQYAENIIIFVYSVPPFFEPTVLETSRGC